ncbi:MAG: S8 family peptidase, partial [Halopseudomonas sp.]
MKALLAALLLALSTSAAAQALAPAVSTAAASVLPVPPPVTVTAKLPPPINDPLLKSTGSWGQSYPDLWGLRQIGLVSDEAEPRGILPQPLEPITVALIDSGVDYSHPDLPISKLWQNPNELANGRDDDGNGLIDDRIGWNFVSHNNNPWDDHGHGTHIAGVIAAARDNAIGISGIAPNARLMVLKVVDASGHASGSHIAQAIRYAVDQGARLIHLSLGGQPPGAVELDALNYALEREVLVVTAAGNQARGDALHGYQQHDQVLVVGALTPDGQRAAFSDWGPTLDLLAPGVDILSLRSKGSDFLRRNGVAGYQPGSAIVQQHYYRATGTSFAAPYVTGLAALILGRDPWLEPQQLQRLLLQSADDIGPRGVDQNH